MTLPTVPEDQWLASRFENFYAPVEIIYWSGAVPMAEYIRTGKPENHSWNKLFFVNFCRSAGVKDTLWPTLLKPYVTGESFDDAWHAAYAALRLTDTS